MVATALIDRGTVNICDTVKLVFMSLWDARRGHTLIRAFCGNHYNIW